MVSEIMKLLAQADGEVGGAILKEYERQSRNLEVCRRISGKEILWWM